MRKKHRDLQRVTWDQAVVLRMASANGFRQLHIDPALVRLWASQGHLKPVAIGPHGNVLYLISDVIKCAETRQRTRDSGPSPT